MQKPLVTAIIPTKDRAGLLPRALRSVGAQSYPNLELVVVDDGSTDETPKVIREFEVPFPMRYIRNETSVGASKARNQGITLAEGVFVAGLDDDDEWHPRRISRLMKAYSDEFACVTSDVCLVYENETVVWNKKRLITYKDLLYSNQVGNQVLVRKDRLTEVGGFDERLKAAQDYDLWVRLSERYGAIKNVQEPLQNVYVEHGGEQITMAKTQLAGYLEFYKKHKHKMNREQRKYQLFTIRRAQNKTTGVADLVAWVPVRWLWKELKRYLLDHYLDFKK